MATPSVKSTYSLDPQSVRLLSETARKWGVSKSEVLRRAIRSVAGGPPPGAEDPLAALDALQGSLRLTPREAQAWEKRATAERRASSRKRETTR